MNKSKSKPNLSKAVLEMKFMQKTKIELEKKLEDSENIEMLTSNIKGDGKECQYMIERSWGFIENLRGPRFNYGMSQQKTIESITSLKVQQIDNSKQDEGEKGNMPSSPPKKKFKRHR